MYHIFFIYTGYCKQCCSERWGVRIFGNYGFLQVFVLNFALQSLSKQQNPRKGILGHMVILFLVF